MRQNYIVVVRKWLSVILLTLSCINSTKVIYLLLVFMATELVINTNSQLRSKTTSLINWVSQSLSGLKMMAMLLFLQWNTWEVSYNYINPLFLYYITNDSYFHFIYVVMNVETVFVRLRSESNALWKASSWYVACVRPQNWPLPILCTAAWIYLTSSIFLRAGSCSTRTFIILCDSCS